jgi:hypothetical protein
LPFNVNVPAAIPVQVDPGPEMVPETLLGSTEMEKVFASPTQPSYVGVTVNVAVTVLLEVLVVIKVGMGEVVPLEGDNPIKFALVALQVNEVPEPFKGELAVKSILAMVVPLHTCCEEMVFNIGFGLIVTTYSFGIPAHPLVDGVIRIVPEIG